MKENYEKNIKGYMSFDKMIQKFEKYRKNGADDKSYNEFLLQEIFHNKTKLFEKYLKHKLKKEKENYKINAYNNLLDLCKGEYSDDTFSKYTTYTYNKAKDVLIDFHSYKDRHYARYIGILLKDIKKHDSLIKIAEYFYEYLSFPSKDFKKMCTLKFTNKFVTENILKIFNSLHTFYYKQNNKLIKEFTRVNSKYAKTPEEEGDMMDNFIDLKDELHSLDAKNKNLKVIIKQKHEALLKRNRGKWKEEIDLANEMYYNKVTKSYIAAIRKLVNTRATETIRTTLDDGTSPKSVIEDINQARKRENRKKLNKRN